MVSIAKKWIMAFSGLFLCLFLVGHLAGNLILLKCGPGTEQAFNDYAEFMTTNPAVQGLRILTFLSVGLHVIFSIILTMKNKAARSQKYAYSAGNTNSAWNSRYMAVLGIITLLFVGVHLKMFMIKSTFCEVDSLYALVITSFKDPITVVFYVLCMAALSFHLGHGFSSAFQSLGLRHKKYTPMIEKAGAAFAILVPLGFAAIPVFVFFCKCGTSCAA